MLLLPHPQDLVVDLLRGCRASAGRIDMQNDGFHGRVIAKLPQLASIVSGDRIAPSYLDHRDAVRTQSEASAESPPPTERTVDPDHDHEQQRQGDQRTANDRRHKTTASVGVAAQCRSLAADRDRVPGTVEPGRRASKTALGEG